MDFLPVWTSPALILFLCTVLLAWGFRNWYLAQCDTVRRHLLFESGKAIHRERLTAIRRLQCIFDRQREIVFQFSDKELISYDILRALKRAVLVVPLAIVAARAATEDKVLGIFDVFSGQPDMAMRLACGVLVMLVFAGTVMIFPRFTAWAVDFMEKGRNGGTRWQANLVVVIFPIMLIYPLQFSGLTKPYAYFLSLSLAISCLWTLPKIKGDLGPEALPLGHAMTRLGLAAGSLIIMLPFYFLFGSFSGLIALVLLLGLIMPLAIAPAVFVALVCADRMLEDVVNTGYGRWRLPGLAMKAVCFAGLSLVLLGLGMALALWLFSALGPANYQPDVMAFLSGLLSERSMGAPFVILAAVTLWPFLAVPVMALADTLIEYSPSKQTARALLFTKDGSEKDIVRALVWAQVTGWAGALLILGLPILLFFVQAGAR